MVQRAEPMRRKHSEPPLEWIEVRLDDGLYIGRYAVRDGMTTVQHASGQKKVMRANTGTNLGLAMLILSEFDAPSGAR